MACIDLELDIVFISRESHIGYIIGSEELVGIQHLAIAFEQTGGYGFVPLFKDLLKHVRLKSLTLVLHDGRWGYHWSQVEFASPSNGRG
jgi:hypothetical protein